MRCNARCRAALSSDSSGRSPVDLDDTVVSRPKAMHAALCMAGAVKPSSGAGESGIMGAFDGGIITRMENVDGARGAACDDSGGLA